MPPFQVRVEVIPNLGEADPLSVNEFRKLKNSGIDGSQNVSSLQLCQTISFRLEADDSVAAEAQVQDLCDRLLVNKVLATADVTIVEVDD